jgi:hypothetical protein
MATVPPVFDKSKEYPGRVWHAGRWRTPAQVEAHKEAMKRYAKSDKAKEYARNYQANMPEEQREKYRAKKRKDSMTDEEWAEHLQRVRARRYGLTVEEVEEMLGRGCALCGSFDRIVIDHDHETGAVRGALCGPHNRALGMIGDTLEAAQALVEYLS